MISIPANALLDLASGELLRAAARHARVSDMRGYYRDAEAEARLAEGENPLVYAYAESAAPAGTRPTAVRRDDPSTRPGRRRILHDPRPLPPAGGGERGCPGAATGRLVLEHRDGRTEVLDLRPGVVFGAAAPGFAHRSVNVGDGELVFFAVWPAGAGHDYGTIVTRGFKARMRHRQGRPAGTAIEG